MLYSFVRGLVRLLARILFRLRVVGLEHVPREGALVFAPNHVSYLDIPMLGAVVPRPLHFIGRAGLFRFRLVGWLYRRLNGIPLQSRNSPAGGLRPAIRRLHQGRCVVLYPEGRRSLSGELQPPLAGIGMLASVAGVRVIPVYVDGTQRALPVGTARVRFCPVTVYIGKPLEFKTKKAQSREKDQYQAISRRIMEAIAALRDEARRGSRDALVGDAADSGRRQADVAKVIKGRDK